MEWHKIQQLITKEVCLKSILDWQQLSNFSFKAESLGTFPLNMCQCLFDASHFSLVPAPGQVVMSIQLVRQHQRDELIGACPSHASISLHQTRGPIFFGAWWRLIERFCWAFCIGPPVGFFNQTEKNFFKVSCGPCDGAAIGPFVYHPVCQKV